MARHEPLGMAGPPGAGAAAPTSGEALQNAALCWRMHHGRVEVLLITSRDTGRWVLPKGWPMPGRTGAEAAGLEAWEEAGVTGAVAAATVGAYVYDKVLAGGRSLRCSVDVYPLRVTSLARRFPERKERRRKWFDLARAARKVAEPDLRALLLAFRPDAAGHGGAGHGGAGQGAAGQGAAGQGRAGQPAAPERTAEAGSSGVGTANLGTAKAGTAKAGTAKAGTAGDGGAGVGGTGVGGAGGVAAQSAPPPAAPA
jgi:8-oxo-dGTP pyrophosphatase MutT (NUDIX family)